LIFEKRNSWLIKLVWLDDDVFPGGEEISAEEVAALAGTINYEVVTSILPRVTRVYLKGGEVVEVKPLVEDG
jgi:hypothetical protein